MSFEKITPENAVEQYEKAGVELRRVYAEQQGEAADSGSAAPKPVPQAVAAPAALDGQQDPASAGEPAKTEPPVNDPDSAPSAKTEEPVSESLDAKYEELARKHEILEKRFKAIQTSITPTQQENARLREEVRAIQEKQSAAQKADAKAGSDSLEAALEQLDGVLPEAAKAIREMQAKQSGNSPDVDARLNEITQQLDRDRSISFHREALGRYQDIPDFYGSQEFRDGWLSVYAAETGDDPKRLNEILDYPWRHANGPELVYRLIDSFKADTAAKAPPAPPAPNKAPAPVPTDMAPAARPQTLSGIQPDRSAKPWTTEQHLAIRREIRGNCTPERRAEIDRLLQAQEALQQR